MRQAIWFAIVLAGTGSAQCGTLARAFRSPPSSFSRDMLAATTLCGRAWECLPWRGPIGWPHVRKTGRTLSWRAALHPPSKLDLRRELVRDHRCGCLPRAVLNAWAAESRDYDYISNRCSGVCGHYTQIVWRDTKEVGCAMARGEDARSGSAITIRQATGPAGGRIRVFRGPGCTDVPDGRGPAGSLWVRRRGAPV